MIPVTAVYNMWPSTTKWVVMGQMAIFMFLNFLCYLQWWKPFSNQRTSDRATCFWIWWYDIVHFWENLLWTLKTSMLKKSCFDHETRKIELFPCYGLKISTTKISKSTFSHPHSKLLATAKVGLAHYDSFRGGVSHIVKSPDTSVIAPAQQHLRPRWLARADHVCSSKIWSQGRPRALIQVLQSSNLRSGLGKQEKRQFLYTSRGIVYQRRGPRLYRLVGLVVRRPPRERKVPGSNPACAGIFSGSSHTSDLKIGTPVATLLGAWR